MSNENLDRRFEMLERQIGEIRAGIEKSTFNPEETQKRIDAIVSLAEQAQRKADDEARRANDAKLSCEEHAKFTSVIRGQVEVELAAINAIRTKGEESERALSALRTASDESVKVIEGTKTVLLLTQEWVSENTPKLHGGLQLVTSNKNATDALLAEAQKASAEVKAASTDTASIKGRVEAMLGEVTTLRAQTEVEAKTAASQRANIDQEKSAAAARYAQIQDIATDLEKRHVEIQELRTKLKELSDENVALSAKAEQLLPHAASAGLASAFREQKNRFKKPQVGWLAAFVVTLALLFLMALPDYWNEIFGKQEGAQLALQWDTILRNLIHRLPLVLPLVWLAIYAGRNYSMAVRMEEDYAFKEAVSTAFEGYKREMASIPLTNPAGHSPIMHLCDNVLGAIAQRPGRIYEGKHQDVTPLTPVMNAAEAFSRAKPATADEAAKK